MVAFWSLTSIKTHLQVWKVSCVVRALMGEAAAFWFPLIMSRSVFMRVLVQYSGWFVTHHQSLKGGIWWIKYITTFTYGTTSESQKNSSFLHTKSPVLLKYIVWKSGKIKIEILVFLYKKKFWYLSIRIGPQEIFHELPITLYLSSFNPQLSLRAPWGKKGSFRKSTN